MTRGFPESHPLLRLFRGLTESTFEAELGIADPRLVDYMADLLARFVDAREAEPRRLAIVPGLIAEAESAGDPAVRCEGHRKVGDLTLFWAGVYPESLKPRRSPDGCEHLIDFRLQGKRSYYVASTLSDDEPDLLRRLSDEFEVCAFGLSRIREEWERRDDRPGRLIVA